MWNDRTLHVIGAGLAGSEAAWQAAQRGLTVILHEMRPTRMTEAHKTGGCAELVCSNSFRSDDCESNAVGLLHEEMRRAGSLIMDAAGHHKLPAGGALAVDREGFSKEVTGRLHSHPSIRIERGEVAGLPPSDWAQVIIATGPLTSPSLSTSINRLTGEDALAFFDAIAPIVIHESIDMDVAWMQSRYDKPGPAGTGADYINCPMDAAQYNAFIDTLLSAEKTDFKEWEKTTPYFEGCLPIEVGRPHGPAYRAVAACRRAAAAGQRARHAVEHGRLSDQIKTWRAEPRLSHDPRPRTRRLRPPWRTAPQHIPEQP
jgi:methylenetetrahydrofolate--tRNA-(uracil-5-)-methyltransferase